MRLKAVVAMIIVAMLSQAPVPAGNATITYRLKKGEGFADVSRKYGVPLQTLIKANRHRLPHPGDPNYVFAGMAVSVPGRWAPVTTGPKPVLKPAAPTTGHQPVVSPVNNTGRKTVPFKSPGTTQTTMGVGNAADDTTEPTDNVFKADKTISNLSPEARAELDKDNRAKQKISIWAQLRGSVATAMPWVWLAVALFAAGVIYFLARKVSETLSAAEARDNGMLRLIASRDLGKHSKIFWFRAGERDLFITQGADAQIITIESPPEPEPIAVYQPAPAAPVRRPRKNTPGTVTDQE